MFLSVGFLVDPLTIQAPDDGDEEGCDERSEGHVVNVGLPGSLTLVVDTVLSGSSTSIVDKLQVFHRICHHGTTYEIMFSKTQK